MASAALVGAAVGLVVGLTSLGGGALLTPALVLLLGVPPSIAVGTDVFIAAGMKLFGGGAYALRRAVHWPTVLRLAAGSVPGALLGAAVLNRLPRSLLDATVGRALGAALVLAGAAALRLLLAARRAAPPQRMPGAGRTALLGFATGLLVSTTSVGSGSLLMCVLALLFPLPAQALVGTDLVHALLLSSAAAASHFASGRVDLALAGPVLAGAVPGVLLGAALAAAMPERSLRAGLAALLVATGVHLLRVPPGPARAAPQALAAAPVPAPLPKVTR